MPTRPNLATLLDWQASALQTQLRGVFDGAIDAVHGARVATRRIRELLTLVPLIPGREGEKDVAGGYAEIGRALGDVRDLDVQIALIHELEAHMPQAAPSLGLVRQDHESERLVKMRRLIKTLERLNVDALLRGTQADHPGALRTRLTAAGWRRQLRRLVIERAHVAGDRIAHATGVYFPNRAHGARISIKRLRYAAEISDATGLPAMRAPIKCLSKAQEILGDLHDRQALADRLKKYGKRDGVDPDDLKVTRQVLSGEVQEMHARYLARRAAVQAACADIERIASTTVRHTPALAIGSTLAVTGLVCARWALTDRRTGGSAWPDRPPVRASD